ncbi:MAG TPA: helix-hairpin-helix domain-containing protein [Gemmatimonadales bacterium]
MPAEHRALLILLALAAGGHGARLALSPSSPAPGAIRLLGAGPAGSPEAHRDSIAAHARPLARGERIDVDRASARELERLPGVGPGLARKIAADRAARGPFASLAGLDRVPGIGPAMLGKLEAAVSFSGVARPGPDPAAASGAARSPPASAGAGAAAAGPSVRGLATLNDGPESTLQALPGIGPAKARAIVAYREVHGPFASVQALENVPGIGPALAAKVAVALGLP